MRENELADPKQRAYVRKRCTDLQMLACEEMQDQPFYLKEVTEHSAMLVTYLNNGQAKQKWGKPPRITPSFCVKKNP